MSTPTPAPASAIDHDNPWIGLDSYTESARGFFFGREAETDELSRLVRRQTLTVLFGQSGLGKSSLLQAGLFPLLRETDHLPLYLRLDHAAIAPALADQVKAALSAAFAAAKADAPAFRADETLWEYFHRKDVDIWSAKNHLLTPVLAFDQFEEIFTLGRADEACSARSRSFLAELACLVENRPPAAVQAKLDSGKLDPARFNFAKPSCSVILSLREDFLPDLEGLKREMPALIHNRLRLKKLSGTQALEIVTKPAPHLLAPGVAEKIVEFVAGARGGSAERLAELDVEPPLLSVICRELNDRRRSLGQVQITADLVSGNRREILTDFYERSVADLPAPMRAFIEDRLLTKSGYRDNLALESALEFPGVTRPLLDTLVARRLVRIEDRLGVQRVELTHDVLADVIRASRDTRQQHAALAAATRATRRQRLVIAGLTAVVLLLIGSGLYGLYARQVAMRQSSRTDAAFANQLLGQGRFSDGLAYLVRAAHKDSRNTTLAPRLTSLLSSRNLALPDGAPFQLPARVRDLHFSTDGKHVLATAEDGTLAWIDVATGEAAITKTPALIGRASLMLTHVGPRHGLRGADGVWRIANADTGQVENEFRPVGAKLTGGLVRDTPGANELAFLNDRSIIVGDLATGRRTTLPFKSTLGNPANQLAISQDGRWVAVSFEPWREVEVWDIAAARKVATLAPPHNLLAFEFVRDGDAPVVVTLFPHADGRRVVQQLWSVLNSQPLTGEIALPPVPPSNLAIGFSRSPDGKTFVWSSADLTAAFDSATGQLLGPAMPGAGNVGVGFARPFTPDSRCIAVPTTNGGLQFWDIRAGKPWLPPFDFGGVGRSFSFHDSGAMVTWATNGQVRVWDWRTGKLLAEPAQQQKTTTAYALSPDGTTLVQGTADGRVLRSRIKGGAAQPLVSRYTGYRNTPDNVTALDRVLAFLPGSPTRLIRMTNTRAYVYDAASGRETGSFALPEPQTGAAPGRNGLRADGQVMVVLVAEGEKLQAWWLDAGKGVTTIVDLPDAPKAAGGVAFSAKGDLMSLVSGTGDRAKTAHIWNLRTGAKVAAFETQSVILYTASTPMDFSPDGSQFAAGTIDGTVWLWDIATKRELHQFASVRPGSIRFVRFSTDGQRLFTGNQDGEIQFWNLRSGEPVCPPVYPGGGTQWIDRSPDGRLFASATTDGSAQLWDAVTGQAVGEPMRHQNGIRIVAFTPDSQRLLTCSTDNTARLWDVHTSQPVGEPFVHESRVTGAQISPDGRFALTDSFVARLDNAVGGWIWSLPPDGHAANVPDWLLDLATVCAGQTVNDDGQFRDDPDSGVRLAAVQRTLAALPADAPYADWGRWFLAEREKRAIAPGFTLTPKEAEEFLNKMLIPAAPAPAGN